MIPSDESTLAPAQLSDVPRLTDLVKASFAMAPEWRAPRFMIHAWWRSVLARPDAIVTTLSIEGIVRGFTIYADNEAVWEQIESSGPNRKAVKLLAMLTNPSVLRSRLAKRRKAHAARSAQSIQCAENEPSGPRAAADSEDWRESEFFLGLIATDPTFRGRGLGTSLLQACEGIARDRGKDFVRIYSDPRNERVHRLYERLGYRRAGVHERSVVMVKNLNA